MKASYLLPSGTYNLILTAEDIAKLLDAGRVTIQMSRTPCVTARAVWDSEKKDIVRKDNKVIFNDLRFRLNDPVDDMGPGTYNVQYLNIILGEAGGSDEES